MFMSEELLEQVRARAMELVLVNSGLKGQDLHIKLMGEFLNITNDYIERALSELTQANEIVRVEYTIPNKYSMYLTFYLPFGSRLV